MPPDIHWVSGPWRGRLGIGARPRGDDWLAEDIERWRGEGVDVILSLLTAEEEKDLGLLNAATVAKTHGVIFVSLPIDDMQVPRSQRELARVLEKLVQNCHRDETYSFTAARESDEPDWWRRACW